MRAADWSHPITLCAVSLRNPVVAASAVEAGTASLWNPRANLWIAGELAAILRREKIASVSEPAGKLER
jgi:hypothetical protein